MKFASSAAHATGNKLTSSETFTWLTEHFKTSWSQCKPEVEQAFLAGVNHVFYHGTTYSPANVKWPGWLFYASVNFVPANSMWPHLKGLNDYIGRCQSVLQSGQPDNEILAYWPVYDAWNNAKGMDMPLKVHDVDVWLHPTPFYKNLVDLQGKGYSIDFVSDKMLSSASVDNRGLRVSKNGAAFKVLLVPQCKLMPVETFQQILKLAGEGATVIMQGVPSEVPGMTNLEQRRAELKALVASLEVQARAGGIGEVLVGKGKIIIANDVSAALVYAGVQRESLVDSGLKFIRRAIPDGKYYYLVNHTAQTVNATLPIQFAANTVVIMDPQSGNSGLAAINKKANSTEVRLQLKPGEAWILKAITGKAPAVSTWNYIEALPEPITIGDKWQLTFKDGGPTIPAPRTLDALQSWTDFTDDSTTQNFSGTGVYTTTFTLTSKKAADYILQLDRVNESAKVYINGQEVGILFSIPYEVRVGKYLRTGKNTITIEVANLMANRIRYMDRSGIEWRRYHEINFVNIDYKNFDASKWPVLRSGLSGAVTLLPITNPVK